MGKLIPNTFNLLVVIYVALGSTACSYGMAIIGTTIGQPSFYTSLKLAASGEPGYDATARWLGVFNGVSSAGAAVGAVMASYFANKYSRKTTIQGGALILSIGAALCAGSIDAIMFTIGRIINGLGIGTLVALIPIYQAEVSTPESRGFMVSMHGVMFAVGYAFQAWVSLGVSFITASGSKSSFPWRFPIALQTAPAIILLLGSYWLPYSPRWLMLKGRKAEALEVLIRLHKTKEDPEATMARKEFYQLEKQTELDQRHAASTSTFEIFKTAANRKRAAIGCILMWNNQFTGVLVIANYGIILYQTLGMQKYWPLLLTCIWLTGTLPGNIFCALYVERFGRRKFMLIGLTGILVCLICEAALQAEFLGTTNRAGQHAAVFFIFLFVIPFWSTFMDATEFLYISEIFPNHIRSQGTTMSIASLYLASIVILVAGPTALNNIGWKYFLVFIVMTFLNIFFVYFFCPETKGRSLEEINGLFGEEVAVHYFDATEEEKAEIDNAAFAAVPNVAAGKPSLEKGQHVAIENAKVDSK